ncbi:MAG: hypothetical protein ACYSUI_05125 [Planctomycetota bacterium]|jgi:hypothetical protein
MFLVTEAARIRLVEKLARTRAGDNVAMRFVRRRQGWSLRPDAPVSNDLAFAHEGRTVLVLDPQAAQRLADRTLDAQETPAGSRLRLR